MAATLLFGEGGPPIVHVRGMADEMTARVRPALLVLGASESIGAFNNAFTAAAKNQKIYQKKGSPAWRRGERPFPPVALQPVHPPVARRVPETPAMDAYREEFFGPVGVVYRVADEDEAVKLANDTSFGLGSYLYTTDPEQAARVADRIEAGMVYVNCVLADSPELPFGGVKRSGTARELGLLAADEFVNKKLIRTAG